MDYNNSLVKHTDLQMPVPSQKPKVQALGMNDMWLFPFPTQAIKACPCFFHFEKVFWTATTLQKL